MRIFTSKTKFFNDAGLSTNVSTQTARFLNKDGTFNISKKGLSKWGHFSVFHYLTRLSWPAFLGLIVGLFVVINLVFATLYIILGTEGLSGLHQSGRMSHYVEAFFFSAQTLTTVGYGHITPVTVIHSTIAAIEACFGLLLFAIATGLMYARFAQADGKILFSENAIIAPYGKEGTALMFRCANATNTSIMDAEVQFMLSAILTENGQKTRRFFNLDLERTSVVFFPMSWTVVHPITETSPLFHWGIEELKESDAEFMVLFKGYDTTFNQHVYRPTSYKSDSIVWGARFENIFDLSEDKSKTTVDLSSLNAFVTVKLPTAVG